MNPGWYRCLSLVVLTIGIALPATPARAENPGVWSDGDPKNTLTNEHLLGAATLLGNGKVLVAGGLDRKAAGFPAITTAELYDPDTRTWSVTGPLKLPRWSLDAITLDNGKALFAGGSAAFNGDRALATAEVYDPVTASFSPTANNLSVGRQSSGISRLNDGRILITGGNAAGNNLGGTGETAVDIYDPATNSFRAAASLHAGRALHAQVTLKDGRVLIVGGAQGDAEIYDPFKDTWTVSADRLPTGLKDMKAFELFNGRVLIAAGQNPADGLTTDATWFFDPRTKRFSPGPSMTGFHYAPAGVQVGGSDYSAFDLFPVGHALRGRFVLFAGGEHDPLEGPDVELNSSCVYDARDNKFIDVGPMPFVHDDHTESLLRIGPSGNPEVLLFGGNSTRGTSRFEYDVSLLRGR